MVIRLDFMCIRHGLGSSCRWPILFRLLAQGRNCLNEPVGALCVEVGAVEVCFTSSGQSSGNFLQPCHSNVLSRSGTSDQKISVGRHSPSSAG